MNVHVWCCIIEQWRMVLTRNLISRNSTEGSITSIILLHPYSFLNACSCLRSMVDIEQLKRNKFYEGEFPYIA